MGHPESQDRLLAIWDMLQETKLIEELEVLEPRDATKEEICLVHDPKYFDVIKWFLTFLPSNINDSRISRSIQILYNNTEKIK